MALHIQMSEEAEAELRKNALRNKLSSLLACVLFMAMGGGILFFTAVFIVGDTPVSFLSYTPPSEEGPPSNNPTPRELVSRSAASSSTVAPSVIVATSAASVSMAPVEIDMSDGLALDTSLDLGLGMGEDLGEGMGSGGKGLGDGSASGSALEGTFYDLKQSGKGRSRRVSNLGVKNKDGSVSLKNAGWPLDYYDVLANFINKGWSPGVLNRYYESSSKLYASSFYLPVANAKYGPIAYQVGDSKKLEKEWVCQPSGWCAVYRGRVRAPKSGKFRFIGTGDDCIAVRFNRKLVLEAGYRLFSSCDPKLPGGGEKLMLSGWKDGQPSKGTAAFLRDVKNGKDRDHKDHELISTVEGIGIWKTELGGLMGGTIFEVKEGEEYPIEVMIAESGGAFGFVLFIEDVTNGKNSKAKKYDLFRTNFSEPNAKEINELLAKENCVWGQFKLDIPYNSDSPIWTVTSVKP